MHPTTLRMALARFKPNHDGVWRYGEELDRLADHLSGEDGAHPPSPMLVTLASRLDRYQGSTTMRVWLHRVAAEESRRLARRRPHHPLDIYLDLLVEGGTPGGVPPDEVVAEVDRRLRLLDAVAALPDHQRGHLLLRHGEGLSVAAISRLIGATPASVRSVLYRGRIMLRAGSRL